MKYTKTLLTIAAFVAAVSFANAQSKLAHIDVQKLLSDMPEMKTAQAELKKLEDTYRKDLQASFQEYQTKAELYKNEASAKTPQENEKRATELGDFEKRLGEAQQTAGQELQKKQAELYQPILDKANKAVQKVAKAQGFQYVLDASPGAGVILADGKDLMVDVKKELGF